MGKKGFTLIELLVVISIIALLASIVITRVVTARVRARDAERVSEIRSIQTALTLYSASSGGNFPPSTTEIWLSGTDSVSNALQTGNYISAVPKDPLNPSGTPTPPCTNAKYIYSYITPVGGTSFTLKYCLETDAILGKDGYEGGTNNNPQRARP